MTDLKTTSRIRPRVWTVFLASLVALVAAVAAQAIIAVAMVFVLLADGVSPQDLTEELVPRLMSPPMFIGTVILSQCMFALAAFVPAMMSPEPARTRLGLVRPRCTLFQFAVFALGSLVPLALSVGAAHWVAKFIAPDETVVFLYEQMTAAWAIPFIVLIGIVPGFFEELLFRGYIQRRLIKRWGTPIGILVTSVLFALFHVTPHAMALAFIMGIWLGILAWRTGSIWPGVVCHAFVNSSWNVWQVGQYVWGFPSSFSTTVNIIAGSLMLLFFGLAVWTIVRISPPVAIVKGE